MKNIRSELEELLIPMLERLEIVPLNKDDISFNYFISNDQKIMENIMYGVILLIFIALSIGIYLILSG